ncbi:hypothetical protein [Methyloprofundus sp.]|uniref:hypothetical protein n=1 Tax=Methyloprofundus sp. TaxID=2020875 RepID=UPI003D11304B
MSFKSTLAKFAVKQTPKKMMLWLANKKIKGVAKLTDFHFNPAEHKLYVQMILSGEQEKVELWIEDFTLVVHEKSYKLVIHQAQSTRPWLDKFLRNFALNRELKIPEQYADLIHGLLNSDFSEPEED